MRIATRRLGLATALFCGLALGAAGVAVFIPADAATAPIYQCFRPDGVARSSARLFAPAQPSAICLAGDTIKSWSGTDVPPVTTTSTPTTQPTTTAATTTTAPTTTTTQPGGTPAFMSRPRSACGTQVSGANVVVLNRSWLGCDGVALTVSNATNVTISGVDFDGNVGDIYLVDVSGNVSISGTRSRNTGDGTIGSGHSNVIQLSRTWDNDPAVDIWNVKALGGNTEDVISIYQSGGTSATNTLLVEDVHIEHPLTGAMAWQSDSGTCVNIADGGGKHTTVRNSTFLNCAAVGLQINEPDEGGAKYIGNIVYGATRPTSNVGLSQWSSGDCSICGGGNEYRNNRVFWRNASGGANPIWLSGNYPVADVGNVKQDTTIDPASLRVVL